MFRDDSRPSTGRSRVNDNRNNRSDTALWGEPTNSGRPTTTSRTFKSTSLWSSAADLATAVTTATSSRPSTSLDRPNTTASSHRPKSAYQRTSLWGTIDPNASTKAKPPPVKAAPFATEATKLTSQPPPGPASGQPTSTGPASLTTQPFATEADITPADKAGAEELRSQLTYDLEERYQQAAESFMAADVDRSGYLDENEILRLCHLFNLPIEHVATCFGLCDVNNDKKLNYREFAYHLIRPSYTQQQQQQQQQQQPEAAAAPPAAAAAAAAAAPPAAAAAAAPPAQNAPPAPVPNTGRDDPRFSSSGVSSIFGGPDGALSPPPKYAKGRQSKNRNYAKTSLW